MVHIIGEMELGANMNAMSLAESLYRLIYETSTNLPSDIRGLLDAACTDEQQSLSKVALHIISENVDIACKRGAPICQDTGMPTFLVELPIGCDQRIITDAIEAAVVQATKEGVLRPNSVDPISGRNSGSNLGPGTPVIHFRRHDSEDLVIQLLLKGGGCENVSAQYSLPCDAGRFGPADRDLEGVKRCVLDAVHRAQGRGCAPGYLGVCIGGDRAGGYECAKEQLFRCASESHPDPQIAALERQIVTEANELGIGAMGLGGRATLLGCKIGVRNRLPACFFVTVAYQCWAFRRLGVVLDGRTGEITKWLHRCEDQLQEPAHSQSSNFTGRKIILTPPLTESDARAIRVGDLVVINGPIFTARDEAHRYILQHGSPVDLNGQLLYHCGPIATKDPCGSWRIHAAGPTTSIREEPYQADLIAKYGVRAIIGKGGMGEKTAAALQKYGAVYLSAIGGAAQIYASQIAGVHGVYLLEEFGIPEAIWHLQAEGFTTICTMDSLGGNLHYSN